jgi:hypothetical protein
MIVQTSNRQNQYFIDKYKTIVILTGNIKKAKSVAWQL